MQNNYLTLLAVGSGFLILATNYSQSETDMTRKYTNALYWVLPQYLKYLNV